MDNNKEIEKEPQVKESKKRSLPRFAKIFFSLAALSLPLYIAFLLSPSFSDFFNRYISSALRAVLAWVSSVVPFSIAEFFIILMPLIIVTVIGVGMKKYSTTWRDAFIFSGSILSVAALILSLFVFGFAPGYRGSRLDKKLGIEKTEVSAEELYYTAEVLSALMWLEMDSITYESGGFSVMPYDIGELNQKLLDAYDTVCDEYSFVQKLNSRIKPVMLSELMSYTHITGVYSFFTGEANINIAFPDYTLPFTAAHELSHQRGFAREDEANFMAFLVCAASSDAYIRYSAYLGLYEYVSNALYSADRELYMKSYARLPDAVKGELIAYSEFYEKYRDSVASEVSGAVNNSFLIINGTEGTKSYGMVVDLAVAFFKNSEVSE